MNRCQINF